MNRRNFLQLATLAIAGQAVERVFPFRVYSIPKKITVVPSLYPGRLSTPALHASGECLTPEMLRRVMKQIMDNLGTKRIMPHFYPTDYFATESPASRP
jgi:hypothetical protein